VRSWLEAAREAAQAVEETGAADEAAGGRNPIVTLEKNSY
jgi:hypothetical protein